jgi:uncharacterized protein YndB with AHSA1/START domain
MINETSAENSLTIRRTINALRQKVFDAWTQTDHLKNWWRANPKWSTEIAEVDLRVGGKYRLGMRDPEQDGPFVCCGEFVEVNSPEKVAYTWSWESPGMDVGETLVTVEFIENGEATDLVLTHERFPNSEAATKHNQGWTACIEALVALVESA